MIHSEWLARELGQALEIVGKTQEGSAHIPCGHVWGCWPGEDLHLFLHAQMAGCPPVCQGNSCILRLLTQAAAVTRKQPRVVEAGRRGPVSNLLFHFVAIVWGCWLLSLSCAFLMCRTEVQVETTLPGLWDGRGEAEALGSDRRLRTLRMFIVTLTFPACQKAVI